MSRNNIIGIYKIQIHSKGNKVESINGKNHHDFKLTRLLIYFFFNITINANYEQVAKQIQMAKLCVHLLRKETDDRQRNKHKPFSIHFLKQFFSIEKNSSLQ